MGAGRVLPQQQQPPPRWIFMEIKEFWICQFLVSLVALSRTRIQSYGSMYDNEEVTRLVFLLRTIHSPWGFLVINLED